MPLNILKEINWFDIFALLLVARICYVSLKTGFPIELFKLLGTVLAIYLSLHYYIRLSDLAIESLPIKDLSVEIIYFTSFLILAIAGYLIFALLRTLTYNVVKLEAVSTLNKWGGLVLGIARAVLLTSLLIFIMALSNIEYFKDSIKRSYSGKAFAQTAPETYAWIWNNFTSKFASNEKYNDAILKVEKGLKNK